MECKSCRENLEAYRRGDLPEGMITRVKSHLLLCRDCDDINRLEILADRIIDSAGEALPGSLSTGAIMEYISKHAASGTERPGRVYSIIRPLLLAGSVAAALFAGILIGDLYTGNARLQPEPEELSLLNDSELEQVFSLSDE